MQYYRFDTEAEALSLCNDTITPLFKEKIAPCLCPNGDLGQKICKCSCDEWTSSTVCWGSPMQRTTNTDWVIVICAHINNDGYDIVEIDQAIEWPQKEF